jgi:hypothetical protein
MKKFNSEGNLLNFKSLDVGNTNMSEDSNDIEDTNAEHTWNNLITLDTFKDWISVASYKIECLELSIKIYRWRLQTCIMLGLLLSTASGTISVTQFGNYSSNLKFGLNLVLTITSFAVALLTGIVKTFKLQENLEKYINLKQNWVSFSAKISNEIYLPKKMRSNAETLIKDNKARFLDLLKVDVPIPKQISILAAKHLDKGDDIESQYYKYRENIIKNEKDMNQNYMKCLSFFFNCCSCFYKPSTVRKIIDNKNLEKIIKYSKIENQTKYKRRAYQYTLSSIMINNVKHEYNEIKLQNKQSIETQTEKVEALQDLNINASIDTNKPQIQLKIEETVAVVTNTVSKLMNQKKKDYKEETEEKKDYKEETEEKKEDKKIEKKKDYKEETEEKKEDKKIEKKTEEKN